MIQINIELLVRDSLLVAKVADLRVVTHVVHVLAEVVAAADLESVLSQRHIHLLLDLVLVCAAGILDLHGVMAVLIFVLVHV